MYIELVLYLRKITVEKIDGAAAFKCLPSRPVRQCEMRRGELEYQGRDMKWGGESFNDDQIDEAWRR